MKKPTIPTIAERVRRASASRRPRVDAGRTTNSPPNAPAMRAATADEVAFSLLRALLFTLHQTTNSALAALALIDSGNADAAVRVLAGAQRRMGCDVAGHSTAGFPPLAITVPDHGRPSIESQRANVLNRPSNPSREE